MLLSFSGKKMSSLRSPGPRGASREGDEGGFSMSAQLPVIEVSGSPSEIGYFHGEQCKERIQDALGKFLEYMRLNANLSKERLIELSSPYVPYANEYAPDLVEEMKGIARGSGLPFEEIFVWNSLSTDVMELCLSSPLPNPSGFGCTSLAVSGGLEAEAAFVAQNLDWPSNLQGNTILLRIHPRGGPKSLVLSVAGRLGFAGLNGHGVGLCVNKLSSSDNRIGVPNQLIFRKILQQRTIGESLGVLLYTKRAAGMNYVIMDKYGESINIEATATTSDLLYGFRGSVVHSNHYTAERLKPFERLPACFVDSIPRLNRVSRLLSGRQGKVSLDGIQEIFRDHANFPHSICRHSDERVHEFARMKTIASIITNPRTGKLWCAFGNPCESPYVEYTI
jgi:isopenicillin-N N-acyltransferase like protein